jgi:hypothetical protein
MVQAAEKMSFLFLRIGVDVKFGPISKAVLTL